MATEITVKRPDGTIETVTDTRTIQPGSALAAQMVKATKAAGRGTIITFQPDRKSIGRKISLHAAQYRAPDARFQQADGSLRDDC